MINKNREKLFLLEYLDKYSIVFSSQRALNIKQLFNEININVNIYDLNIYCESIFLLLNPFTLINPNLKKIYNRGSL